MTTAAIGIPNGTCGAVHTANKMIRSIEHSIHRTAGQVFAGIKLLCIKGGQIRADSGASANVLQLGIHLFSIGEIALAKPGCCVGILSRLDQTTAIVGAIQTLDAVHYFASKNEERTVAKNLGTAAMIAASVGSSCEILDGCKLINLGQIAKKTGSVPVLGAATRTGISFAQACGGIALVGQLFFAAQAVKDLSQAKKGDEKHQAILDLAQVIAEVAATIFMCFISTCLIGVIGFGVVAALLGIVSYLHSIAVKEKETVAADLITKNKTI